jgi:chemotaxis-related protein WspD
MSLATVPVNGSTDCWNRIGVWGDRSCPELAKVVHCRNCPVFAAAGRRFLDAPSPEGYLEEWTDRLAAPIGETATDVQSVLIFRLGDEWLALRVQVLVEVTNQRPIRRIPRRAGLLAGLVNIRGELHLCVRLAQLLGITPGARRQETGAKSEESAAASPPPDSRLATSENGARLIVVRGDSDRWVFPVDEVDQVYRFSQGELTEAPATLARSNSRLTQGVFAWRERPIGYLDDARLFQVLRARIR